MYLVRARIWIVVVAFAQLACYAPRSVAPVREWVRTELYFGLSRPDGTEIAETDWSAFVATSIAPRFPAGFTVVPAEGYFGSRDQSPHQEATRLLILFHDPADDGRADEAIAAIAAEFARRFDQESVLRVDAPVRATFARPSRAR